MSLEFGVASLGFGDYGKPYTVNVALRLIQKRIRFSLSSRTGFYGKKALFILHAGTG